MLVFIDESGDSGLKIELGSSRSFTVSFVIFKNDNEAVACDGGIEQLKKKLKWKSNSEFHFVNNSDKVREAFYKEANLFDFVYYGIVINKDYDMGLGNNSQNKISFYKYVCVSLFDRAKDELNNATIIIDKTGNLNFRRQLEKFLKSSLNKDVKRINKIKMQDSSRNNLLQLADYVAGAINRSVSDKRKNKDKYRKMISKKEIFVQVWPKQNSDPILQKRNAND